MSALLKLPAMLDGVPRKVGERTMPAQLSVNTLGMRLRRLRHKRGFTLAQVAGALGVSKPTVWAWERGKCRPQRNRIAAIAEMLGADPGELEDAPVSGGSAADLIEECRERIAEACGTKSTLVRILVEL